MNTPQQIADIIRLQATKQKITVSKMFTDIGLAKNTLSNMASGSMLKADSLGKIADYLSVSVDYLLGRADAPAEYSNNNISNSGDVALGANAQVTKSGELDGLSREMITEFEKLEFSKKAKVISLIAELSET